MYRWSIAKGDIYEGCDSAFASSSHPRRVDSANFLGVAMGDAQGRRQEQAEARLGQGGESRGGNCPPTFGRFRGTSPQRAGPWCGTVYRVTGGVEFEATRGGSFEVGVTLRVPTGRLTLKPLPLSCSRSPSVSMWDLEARPRIGAG